MRIGTKLGVSAGISMLLVVCIVGNTMLSGNSALELTDAASQRQRLAQDVTEVEVSFGLLRVAYRGVILSRANDEVEGAMKEVQGGAAKAQEQLKSLVARANIAANRDRLVKVQSMLSDYLALVGEMAARQKAVFGAWDKRNDLVTNWNKALDALLKSPALANAANGGDIEKLVRESDSTFKTARIASFRYDATRNSDQIARINRETQQATAQLKQARDKSQDSALVKALDPLAPIMAEFTAVIDASVKTIAEQEKLQRERMASLVDEINRLLEETSMMANDRAEQEVAAAAASIRNSTLVGLAVGGFAVLVLLASAVFGTVSIARPIRRIGEILLALAQGDKSVEVPYTARGDEVGDAARAAHIFRDNLVRLERMEAEQKAIEERAASDRKAAVHDMAANFETAVGNIIGKVSSASVELEASAGTLAKNAEVTQQLAATVASASEQASANVQSVASASNEMSSSVNEISRRVQESSRIASEAVQQAGKTDARIGELSQAAGRIGDVVNLITAIAEQTNLLALNATIEAARAGEAGKGFAVVAQEVKALAAQTAKATDEIVSQISGMQGATQDAVAAIKEISATIAHISEIASAIAAAVEEQGAATQEIARNVHEASQGTTLVARNITDVNRSAAETGTASSDVLSAAQTLSGESLQLKGEVDRFLATVRAA